MGDNYYYNNATGSFGAISDPSDWRITIQNDQDSPDNWADSTVRREAGSDSSQGIRFRSNDNFNDEDFDDLVVEVGLY